MSIRLRLILVQTLLVGLVLAAFAVIVYAVIAAQELNQLDYDLRMTAEDAERRAPGRVAISRQVEHGGERGIRGQTETRPVLIQRGERGDGQSNMDRDQQFHDALIDRFEGSTVSLQLVRADGEVALSTSDLGRPIPLPPGFAASVTATAPQTATVTVDEQEMRILGTRVLPGPVGDGMLIVIAASLAPIEATLSGWRMTLSLIVLGTVAAAAAIAWYMASSALRPVDQMAGAARAIGQAADFSRRLPEPAQMDELGRLARTFNEMLEQLAAANSTQRRFLADASHELRTPLTAIATNIEVLRGRGPLEPGERDEMLRAVARETARMSRLVSDLLTLARADAGLTLARHRLALDTLVLDVYQQQRTLTNDITLALGEWEQVEVDADPDRLRQVVLNLVDNAVRYTPRGGTVTLDVQQHGSEAVIRVRDTGIGIAPEHQQRIFERFYRVDQPRTRELGGTGLGLAIAREMARAHGGRIEVESTPGGGSTFSLFLPVLPIPPAPPPVTRGAPVLPRPATASR